MSVLPIAHETWFVDEPPMDWSFAFETATLVLLALALLVTAAVRLAASRFPGVDVPLIARMSPYMPFAVRIHLAVSLVGLLSLGYYLSPAMDLESDAPGFALGATMIVVAITMASGWYAREGAWLLVAAGPIGMLEFGVSPVLQRVDMLGLAVFVLLTGPGRWSADHELGRSREPSFRGEASGVWALRLAAGTALIVVAFVEKLANPDMALRFLAEHPGFNVAQGIGIDMSDLEFTRVAGAIEVLFGLLIISGALPQAVVLIAGIPFNATLYFFGSEELMGHLPIYATMLVLLVYGSDPRLRPAVSSLWPRRLPAWEP
jgi:uncharacterized membrane protein YphA (DoxX/SURF4 family)